MKSVVIRWINESETIPEMEINSCDVAIMLCIYQCQASILLISHRSVPVPVANKGVIRLIHKVTDNLVEEVMGFIRETERERLLENSHWSLTGFN